MQIELEGQLRNRLEQAIPAQDQLADRRLQPTSLAPISAGLQPQE